MTMTIIVIIIIKIHNNHPTNSTSFEFICMMSPYPAASSAFPLSCHNSMISWRAFFGLSSIFVISSRRSERSCHLSMCDPLAIDMYIIYMYMYMYITILLYIHIIIMIIILCIHYLCIYIYKMSFRYIIKTIDYYITIYRERERIILVIIKWRYHIWDLCVYIYYIYIVCWDFC